MLTEGKDVVEESAAGAFVYAHFFGFSKEKLEDEITAYFNEYPSMGYATEFLEPLALGKDGMWRAEVKRYAHCD